jgi:sugar lactone lactonase YvrE
MIADVLFPLGLHLGEGASAINADQLWFVDIRRGQVFHGSLSGTATLHEELTGTVSAAVQTACGGVIVAGKSSLTHLDESVSLEITTGNHNLRLNDGKADPRGRFVVGTMAEPVQNDAGSLWSVASGRARLILSDVTISNGLCWSADGTSMFYIDTPTQRVDVFDYDVATGGVSGRHVSVAIDAEHGAPDGMTIDAEGGLWVALWGGSAVHRYVAGRLDHVIDVPTPFVTSCTFLGTSLVITTAGEAALDDPLGGHVFIAETGIDAPLPHCADVDVIFGNR